VEKINAFILAAGFGERLRPITDHIPKPLVPILGRPVLEITIERISRVAPGQIGVNSYYKQEMIRKWLEASRYNSKITLFLENEVLGIGGALKNAAGFLNNSFFIVHNSDIVSDINLTALIEKHMRSGNMVTLAVHDFPEFNNVWINKNGFLEQVGTTSSAKDVKLHRVAFTGIAIYSPDFLQFLPQGKSNLIDAWLQAVSSGQRVGTEDFSGCFWSDIGTPYSYSSTVFELLKKEGETVYIHPSAAGCAKLDMGANTVIEKDCVFAGEASTRNCILLPGAKVSNGMHIENSIVGPEYAITIAEPGMPLSSLIPVLSELPPFSSRNIELNPIGVGGSDRTYYRAKVGDKTSVVMVSPEKEGDYERHIAYTCFFRKYSLPVPELLWADNENPADSPITHRFRYAVFEDVGDISLYSFLKCLNEPERKEEIYRRVINISAHLHTVVTRNASECPLLQSRIFDYAHLRWETDYFVKEFLCGAAGLDITIERQALVDEFDLLAKKVESFARAIVHRDFQSQNIMLTKGDVPRIIDYQGARMGPPAYDLASVLWDPYYRLEDDMRNRLLDFYLDTVKDFYDGIFDEAGFVEALLPCRLQRHMQALGAYGFLSKVKSKAYFLKYVSPAVRYLSEETELAEAHYPVLYRVVRKLNEKTGY
jgi:NDP-sugar pyrophosphorylase family protein/aminoglycoside/choline kinase family phosphotransferase